MQFGQKKKNKQVKHPTEELNEDQFKKLCEESKKRVQDNRQSEQNEYNELFRSIATRNKKNQNNTFSGRFLIKEQAARDEQHLLSG